MSKKKSKVVHTESGEIDYWGRLSPSEKAYLNQFLLEYYQGDFNNDINIHSDAYRKDCYSRNNESRRQWHSVGTDLRGEAMAKALANPSPNKYSLEDYMPKECDMEAQWDDGLDELLIRWRKFLKKKAE